MLGWMKHNLESRLLGEISITSDMQMTPSLWQKALSHQGSRAQGGTPILVTIVNGAQGGRAGMYLIHSHHVHTKEELIRHINDQTR